MKITFSNSVGATLDSSFAKSPRDAAKEAQRMIDDAGELHPGDHIHITESSRRREPQESAHA